MVLGGVFFNNFTQNSSSFVFFAVFFRGWGWICFQGRGVHVRSWQVVLQPADEFENHAQVPELQRRLPS
jgi:hypothetical protein